MTATEPDPLWEVMLKAYNEGWLMSARRTAYAAELRAINLWIAEYVTQRRNALTGEVTYLCSDLHDALDAEADRAEAGK